MFTVITVLNPLVGGETRKDYKWEKGKPLSHYLGFDKKSVVMWERSVVALPLSEIFPARKEVYTVLVIPEGGDRQTQRLIGYTMMAGISMIPGWGPYASYVGANLINTFLQDKKVDQSESQSYAWEHIASPTAAFGSAMPIVYGKARVRPTLKNRYVTVDGDVQTLYALYSVTGHLVDEAPIERFVFGQTYPFDTIVRTTQELWHGENLDEPGKTYRCINRNGSQYNVPTHTDYWEVWHGTASFHDDIYVNGRAIEDYNADVRWETRPGLAQQTFIEGFDVTYVNHPQDESLYLSMVFMNRIEARIRYSPQNNEVSWARHNLNYHGIIYNIVAGARTLHTYTIFYLVFVPGSNRPDIYQLTTSPASTEYIIATIDRDTGKITYPSLDVDTDSWYMPATTFTNTHNIELIFELPYGLYSRNPKGSLISARCGFFAQYRIQGTTHWNDFAYKFKNSLYTAEFMDNTLTGGLINRKTTKPIAVSIKVLPNGGELLDPNKTYEIRVAAAAPIIVKLVNIATIIYGSENADEDWPGFTYPGESLIGIKALASSQVNSDLDVQVDVERSKVWVWNTKVTGANKWVQWRANNHAWAVYDILVNGYYNSDANLRHPAYPELTAEERTWTNESGTFTAKPEAVYGCGLDPKRIDLESFREWATNLQGAPDSIDYKLNIVFDTFMTAWDAILRICQEGRGMVYPIGSKIYAFTDKAEDVSQIFTMGNIHTDTFVQKYMESGQQVNLIEADFFDKDKNYEKTSITARTSDWDSSRGLSVPSKITLYGTDAIDQAQSIIRRMLMGAELLNNVISFGVDIDSLASRVGDVVGVNHDILKVGQSGRISAVVYNAGDDSGTITLDRTLSISAGVAYTFEVRHRDGTLESKSVTGGVDTDEIVWGAGAWDWAQTPQKYDVYSFGVTGEHAPKYRITEISRTNELMRTLTLMKYDERVYDSWKPGDAALTPDSSEFTAYKNPVSGDTIETVISILNLATNLQLKEVVAQNKVTGEYESSIIATWDTEDGHPRGSWEIWFRDVDASDIDWEGEWILETTYSYGRKVEHDGYTFISMVDDNVNSAPFYR